MAVFKNSARLLGFFEGRLRRMEETCDMRVFSGIAQISIAMGAPVGVIKSILNPALKK